MPAPEMIVAILCVLLFSVDKQLALLMALILPAVVGTNLSGTYQELLAVLILAGAVFFLTIDHEDK